MPREGDVEKPQLGRRSDHEAQKTRRAILDAALELFAVRGFESVGVREIAETAGVTHGLVRHHFGTKDDVWRAVVAAADAEFESALRPVLVDAVATPDPGAGLASVVRGVVHTAAEHPQIVRLLLRMGAAGGERLTHILDRLDPLRRGIVPLASRLRDSGLLADLDDAELFLHILLAGSAPFALSELANSVLEDDVFRPDYINRHADRLVRMLIA